MANSPQAKKRARQAVKRRTRNVGMASMYRTFVKKVVYAIDSGDKAAAQEAYKQAVPVIDRMCNKGLVHANKASRHKSRLNSRIRAMA
ncbi:MAG TPA: 30S ribosomal protein S20 [Gammaproteobacteria bacterium]